MRIEDLIEEGEFLGTTMTKSPVPSNIMGIGDWYYAFPDSVGYWAWTNKCIIFLRQNGYTEESKELKKYADKKHSWHLKNSYEQMMSILKAVKEMSSDKKIPSNRNRDFDEKKVFIVHGHNDKIKQTVARTLETIGLAPIILAEQPDKGRTVIEKFESEGNNVGFAVVLLTADDKGRKNYARKMQDRARQNVVFEMGYFMALLGRERVLLLLQEGVEEPSDLKGVVYTPLDKEGVWRYKLVKELREQGYEVSSDSLR
jgi:predicted nucleotide-binding protein